MLFLDREFLRAVFLKAKEQLIKLPLLAKPVAYKPKGAVFQFTLPIGEPAIGWRACYKSSLTANVFPGSRIVLLPLPVSVRNH
jgi:hypothetical protein